MSNFHISADYYYRSKARQTFALGPRALANAVTDAVRQEIACIFLLPHRVYMHMYTYPFLSHLGASPHQSGWFISVGCFVRRFLSFVTASHAIQQGVDGSSLAPHRTHSAESLMGRQFLVRMHYLLRDDVSTVRPMDQAKMGRRPRTCGAVPEIDSFAFWHVVVCADRSGWLTKVLVMRCARRLLAHFSYHIVCICICTGCFVRRCLSFVTASHAIQQAVDPLTGAAATLFFSLYGPSIRLETLQLCFKPFCLAVAKPSHKLGIGKPIIVENLYRMWGSFLLPRNHTKTSSS